LAEEFDFEAWREWFPTHWDARGWPALKSTWRSRNFPMMRVQVLSTLDTSRVHEGSILADQVAEGKRLHGDVVTMVFWDGPLDELRGLFTYENTERWNINGEGFVCGAGGIDRDGRWRADGPALEVTFHRAMFGGPHTWHINFEDQMPFFEPIPDWEQQQDTN
jgi:hypothetical protein